MREQGIILEDHADPALLRRERLIPVVHGTTYEELEQVSLLLASRAGLSTAEESMADIAAKIAELVAT
ncbi:MAG TPA: con [Pseudomonas sp.]|nr:con [Pseudomonas sp.]